MKNEHPATFDPMEASDAFGKSVPIATKIARQPQLPTQRFKQQFSTIQAGRNPSNKVYLGIQMERADVKDELGGISGRIALAGLNSTPL
jgi:hypothetical protein